MSSIMQSLYTRLNVTTPTGELASLKAAATGGGVSTAPILLWLDSITSYFFNVPFPVMFAAFFGAMIMLTRQQPITQTKMTSFLFGTLSVLASAGAAAFTAPLIAAKFELATTMWLGVAFLSGLVFQGLLPNLTDVSKALANSGADIANTFVEALKKRINSFIGGDK